MSVVPAWAEAYVGLPFCEFGRTRSGVDCWGLAQMVLAEHFRKRNLPDFLGRYAGVKDKALPALFEDSLKAWQRVVDPAPGDIVVLNIGGKPWHVGVVIVRNRMLTIDRSTASVIERLDSLRWVGRIGGYYRWVS